jgi:hypothetical protein
MTSSVRSCSIPTTVHAAQTLEAPRPEYARLAEHALFIALFSGVAVMASSFALQVLSGRI